MVIVNIMSACYFYSIMILSQNFLDILPLPNVTASNRQKAKLPWLQLHARTVYASKFLLCMSDSNYLPYFRTITNTAIDRMASVATAPAAAALFPFFRLMIQPAPFHCIPHSFVPSLYAFSFPTAIYDCERED